MQCRGTLWRMVVRARENLESLPWMVGAGGQQLDSPALCDLGSQCDIPPQAHFSKTSLWGRPSCSHTRVVAPKAT